MTILLIGASGQLGQETLREAAARNIPVRTVGRADIDLSDFDAGAFRELLGRASACINAAAFTAVDCAEDEPRLARAINAEAPAAMARVCREFDIPFVHFSTDYVFDGEKNTPYTEGDETRPKSVYGQTKLDGEAAVLDIAGRGAVLRLAWVFSAHRRNFVKTMLRLGRQHGAVRVVDDQWGTPTPARAAASAGLTAARRLWADASLSGVYHYASDEPVTWAGLAEAVFKAAHLPVPVTPITTAEFPTTADRPAYSVLDTAKIETTMGVRPADWRAGLADVLRELQSQREVA